MKKLLFLVIFGLLCAGPALAAPSKVTGLNAPKAFLKANQAKITWDAQSNIDKYIIKLRKNNGKLLRTKKTTNPYKVFAKLKKNKGYKVQVRAKDKSGKYGPWSKKYRFKTRNWKYYHNKKYGFNLKFPKCYKGYDVEKVVIAESEVDTVTFYFRVPTENEFYQDPPMNGNADMFAIVLYTPLFWATIEGSEIEGLYGEKLAETNDYVYAWAHTQDAPDDVGDQLAAIADIIDTFKLD